MCSTARQKASISLNSAEAHKPKFLGAQFSDLVDRAGHLAQMILKRHPYVDHQRGSGEPTRCTCSHFGQVMIDDLKMTDPSSLSHGSLGAVHGGRLHEFIGAIACLDIRHRLLALRRVHAECIDPLHYGRTFLIRRPCVLTLSESPRNRALPAHHPSFPAGNRGRECPDRWPLPNV